MKPTRAVAALAPILLIVSGCSHAPAQPAGSELRPVSPTIASSYDGYWNAWLRANADSDPADPALAQHAANPNLEVLQSSLTSDRRQHEQVRGTVGHAIRGMEPVGKGFRVFDCVDLTNWVIVNAATGKPVDQLVARPAQLGAFTLELIGGTWKVTHGQILGDC
jgi:hypothetical protein